MMTTRTFSSLYRPYLTSACKAKDYPTMAQGIIAELSYNAQKTEQMLWLAPLLRQFCLQRRWMLWIAPFCPFTRNELQQAGLAVDRIIFLPEAMPEASFSLIEKALRTGNYSAALCWTEQRVSQPAKRQLENAAQQGNACGLFIHSQAVIDAYGHAQKRALTSFAICH